MFRENIKGSCLPFVSLFRRQIGQMRSGHAALITPCPLCPCVREGPGGQALESTHARKGKTEGISVKPATAAIIAPRVFFHA